MNTKKKFHNKGTIGYLITFLLFVAAAIFCFTMVNTINQRMNESATANLLNTTKVIEGTMEGLIQKDFDALTTIGDFYKEDDDFSSDQLSTFCNAFGFDWVAVVDTQGKGVDSYANEFNVGDIPIMDTWTPRETGYSDPYTGRLSGRSQIMLWEPLYEDKQYIGSVLGSVILSKYYSANVFTFYNGEGRTYIFDGTNGKWIMKSLGTDGVASKEDDIYSLLLASGNDQKSVAEFKKVVKEQQTGTAIFNFNGKESYLCFLPLTSSQDWYITTVIAEEDLLQESSQVKRMIQWMIFIVCVTLAFATVVFVLWQVRRAKAQEVYYRDTLFSNISANLDSAFLIYDKSSKNTVFVSDNIKRLLGLERAWLIENPGHLFDWCKISKGDEAREAFLEGALEKAVIREVCVENELGEESRYIRLELIPADLDQELAVLTDITKEKEIQSSLLEATQQAEAASHAKNDFMSSMSHDIRTPINGIMGMTAIAGANLQDENRIKDCLGKISEASEHLLSLVNEVLDMSHIESGKVELLNEPFNLPQLLHEVLNINYPGIQQKNHTLNAHIYRMEHEEVIGDASRLKRVVTNLLSNAIKYTPSGGTINLELQEKPPMIQGYGCYEMVVQDNGIGMSPEFQEKIFQPFEREEDVRISRIQGTGLGMSIVQNLVNLMMGNIQMESEKGKGSTFRVVINLRLNNQKDEQDIKITGSSVLVVDDNMVNCETVTDMLWDIGIAGEWSDNGPEAVEMVVEHHNNNDDYLAVLLDWKMPGMDGIETARRIRQEVAADIPVIILTAYDWSEIENEAREAGIDFFLAKPIYKAELLQKLTDIAGGHGDEVLITSGASIGKIPPDKHILLVEDNDLNREIAIELLHMLGISADCAENGAEAVEKFSNSKPGTYDLILMDIQMPIMNGYEATKAIRSMHHADSGTIPIVAMTADAFKRDKENAYVAGMNEHIAKPISVDKLTNVLVRFLSRETGNGRRGE